MKDKIAVMVETGAKKAFASAVEWPGWSRGGRNEEEALETLVGYVARYRAAIGAAAKELEPPADTASVKVVERLKGGSGTDFGIPTQGGAADERALDEAGLERLTRLLRGSWGAFDRAGQSRGGCPAEQGPARWRSGPGPDHRPCPRGG